MSCGLILTRKHKFR